VNALATAYPEHVWEKAPESKPWPKNTWKDPNHLRDFFEKCKKELDIQKPEDWHRVSMKQIINLGGKAIYSYGNLGDALALAYPKQQWDLNMFSRIGKKSAQRWLALQLKKILPEDTQIFEDFRHPLLTWTDDSISAKMQIDLWIPTYNLAIEYQGEHHFHEITGFGPSGTLALYENRDTLKKTLAAEKNIFFLAIPYWWDGQSSSLRATLHEKFPDLFPEVDGIPIPSKIPIRITWHQNKKSIK